MTAQASFGSCWSCITDVDMPSTMATGFVAVGQAIARRWSTPAGGLVGDANYGYDLTDFVNDDLDTRDLPAIAHRAGAEAEKDERVTSAPVTITLIGGLLFVAGKIQTASGPFQLVVSVSNVTVTLLQASAI